MNLMKIKNIKKTAVAAAGIAVALAMLAGCAGEAIGGSESTATPEQNSGNNSTEDVQEDIQADDPSEQEKEITDEFSISSDTGSGYTIENGICTITEEGTYTVSGLIENGQIVVNAPDTAKVVIELNGVSVTCSTSSPVCVLSADSCTIKALDSTYNEITDSRSSAVTTDTTSDEAEEATANAAIFSECDLTVSGSGNLVVTSSANSGIHAKGDLTFKKITLKVTSADYAAKGNDSVTVESGDLILISTGGDGLKTSNSDTSSSGKQRGTVTVAGGKLNIFAACDGITAAYDAVIESGAAVAIYTDSYSTYTGSVSASGGSDFYLILSSSIYSSSHYYYGYYYNTGSYDSGVWAKATYSTMVYSGRTGYYGLKLSVPSGYDNVAFFEFSSNSPSTDTYVAKTSAETINTSKNAFLVSSSSSSTLDGDWVSLSTSSSSSSSRTGQTYSTKGIKASNEVTINGGTIEIYSSDDGIHANNDVTLETGSTGTGNVNINGGYITITSKDDGIHADNIVNAAGGNITVVTSYEGIEGNVINISGGTNSIYATDDGMNASSGNATPTVNVTGGSTSVETPSGDTDAIDSNGNYVQSGGFVLVKGGSSQGSVAGSVDVDGSIKVTGGTIASFGGICETPTTGSCNCAVWSSTTFSSGSYTITDGSGNTLASFELDASFSSCWFCSENLTTGTSYTMTCGSSTVATWTQSSSTQYVSGGSSGGSSWGGGGMGGGGMGGRGH